MAKTPESNINTSTNPEVKANPGFVMTDPSTWTMENGEEIARVLGYEYDDNFKQVLENFIKYIEENEITNGQFLRMVFISNLESFLIREAKS